MVSGLVVLSISWSANAAGMEATTDEGKRVLLNDDMTWQYIESKQDKVANAAVEFAQMVLKDEGRQLTDPAGIECQKSAYAEYFDLVRKLNDPESTLLSKMATVENLEFLVELGSMDKVLALAPQLFEMDDPNLETLTHEEKLLYLAFSGLTGPISECANLIARTE